MADSPEKSEQEALGVALEIDIYSHYITLLIYRKRKKNLETYQVPIDSEWHIL